MRFKRPILFLIILFNISVFAQEEKKGNSPTETTTVLFVCEHGAARSAIASAYFNKLANEKGLNYRAIFRGTDPDTVLTPGTIKGLAGDGFDVKEWRPIMVKQSDVSLATKVVTFDCSIPVEIKSDKSFIKWDGIPAISKGYQDARDQIRRNVEVLIEELSKRKK